MLVQLSPKQKVKCEKCEWRNKDFDSIVLCPFARSCIRQARESADEEVQNEEKQGEVK